MLEHTIRCDVTLPNGHQCETKTALNDTMGLPPGWSKIMTSRRPTAEDAAIMGYMRPMLSAAAEIGEQERANKDGVKTPLDVEGPMNRAMAGMIEQMPSIVVGGHVCPNHELPKVKEAKNEFGGGGGLGVCY